MGHVIASWITLVRRPLQATRGPAGFGYLERQGFECYLPAFSLERRRHGHIFEIREPVFPRYFFIRLNGIEDNWYPIRSTRGVNQIVRANGHPVPVRDDIIEGIRVRL